MGLLRTYRIPPEDAEDLIQQTLLALVYRQGTVRNPEAWLLGVVRKKCLMYWRSKRRRIDEPVGADLLEWLAGSTGPPQEKSDLSRDLETLLACLPQRYRRLLKLRFFLGLEVDEVAQQLGYRSSSIGKITSRCLATLSAQAKSQGWSAELEPEKGLRLTRQG